jgi:hypothetical protein
VNGPIGLLVLACAKAPQKPPMVGASEAALRACSTAEIVAYRNQLAARVSEPARAALESRYERAVASWAVCQILHGRQDWSIPPIVDEPSQALLRAARAAPGTAERIRAYVKARDALPEATALLALQDLEKLVGAVAADPGHLPVLTAYVCAPEPVSGESLCGGPGALGLAGLETLRALAFPSVDPQNPLTVAFREPVHASWEAIGRHRIPLAQTPPLPVKALPVGPGRALATPIGPPYVLVGNAGGLWLAGPTVALTPESMSIDVAAPLETDWPDDVPVGPYLWIDASVPAASLAAIVEGHAWKQPVIVGTDAAHGLVALDVPLPTRLALAPTDHAAIVVPETASVQDLVTLARPGAALVLVGSPPR